MSEMPEHECEDRMMKTAGPFTPDEFKAALDSEDLEYTGLIPCPFCEEPDDG